MRFVCENFVFIVGRFGTRHDFMLSLYISVVCFFVFRFVHQYFGLYSVRASQNNGIFSYVRLIFVQQKGKDRKTRFFCVKLQIKN